MRCAAKPKYNTQMHPGTDSMQAVESKRSKDSLSTDRFSCYSLRFGHVAETFLLKHGRVTVVVDELPLQKKKGGKKV